MAYDINEIDKFDNLSHSWWDIDGELKTLHHINPCRMKFIKKFVDLKNKKVIDVGCGGGILSEALSSEGSYVTGIDLSSQAIDIAKLHLCESKLNIDYRCCMLNNFSPHNTNIFDVVVCMEMLEHVTNYEAIIDHCSRILKPGGMAFFSTLNRGIKSYVFGVLFAEYILNIIPKGTHDYIKFIKPSELKIALSKYNIQIIDIKGLNYNPITANATLSSNVNINYIICCKKIEV